MIRLISQSLGGEAYLNFMGNEFGHPEWIDFPREGNNNSFHYCRRQWNLLRDEGLRYGQLAEFDRAMNELEVRYSSMIKPHQYITLMHEDDKLIVYEKGDLVYIFNFHWEKSYEHYQIGTHWGTDHFMALESDMEEFGGF
jgi:1,4-alpha-glucan branching enzyme